MHIYPLLASLFPSDFFSSSTVSVFPSHYHCCIFFVSHSSPPLYQVFMIILSCSLVFTSFLFPITHFSFLPNMRIVFSYSFICMSFFSSHLFYLRFAFIFLPLCSFAVAFMDLLSSLSIFVAGPCHVSSRLMFYPLRELTTLSSYKTCGDFIFPSQNNFPRKTECMKR